MVSDAPLLPDHVRSVRRIDMEQGNRKDWLMEYGFPDGRPAGSVR
jgi:hypothetical protein